MTPSAVAVTVDRHSPYAAADGYSQELSSWFPAIGSADSDYLWDRDTIVARTRDIVRNSGWASGATSRYLDNIIGSGWRLSSKPDYKALGQTPEWAAEWAEDVEGRWRLYAEDPDNWNDAARQDTVNGQLGLAFRHQLVDGEALAGALWDENKPFGRYATTIQIVDPDRLSNPYGRFDDPSLRAGVEINENGAPVAYHIRRAHPCDSLWRRDNWSWERVARETAWGRRQIIHAYDKERSGQTRGISKFAPILERLKMVDKYDKTELQAALINAIFAAFIESPFDHDLLEDALDTEKVTRYQQERAEFHNKRQISLQGARIATLYPGEKFNMQSASRPAAQFGEFEKACLRNIASGVGLSYEQLSQDWSSTNYSSARASLLEVGRTFGRSRQRFGDQFATPIFILWLEEAISRGDVTLPAGAPDFYTAKAAYCRVRWIGPGRGWVDPVKEVQAAVMRMEAGISTLEDECAEQGKDWQETMVQQKREMDARARLGLPPVCLTALPAPAAEPQDDEGSAPQKTAANIRAAYEETLAQMAG